MDSQQEEHDAALSFDAICHELGVQPGTFKPVARYHERMDWIEFVNEDVSYRADRINPVLELLWHPQKMKIIGVKISCLTTIFLNDPQLVPEDRGAPLALAQILKSVITGSEPTYGPFWAKLYRIAIEVVGDATIAADEWRKALPVFTE